MPFAFGVILMPNVAAHNPKIIALCLAVNFFSIPAHAATLDASASLQGQATCFNAISDTTSVVATCGDAGLGYTASAFSYANPGRIGGQALVDIVSNIAPGISSFSVRADVASGYNDVLSVSIGSGMIMAPIDISGSLTGGTYSTFQASYGFSTAYANLFSGNLVNGTAQTVAQAFFPIVSGLANFSLSFSGTIQCTGGAFTGGAFDTSCAGGMDFAHSARVLGVTVFDSLGNIVTNPTITSQSGFNYLAGDTPHVAPVPVPSTGAMLGSLVLCIGFFASRSRFHKKNTRSPTVG
ncbi:MAG: hypothetical protein H6895_14260 [Defluviimonas sp.]|uniref:hypothetical protein n=1 Tax=Albidovulum sp. TaxID=1872424 RepID=UPI002A2F4798|nr:hypothetical protein [Defluviimonas sp.]